MNKDQRLESYVNHFLAKEIISINEDKPRLSEKTIYDFLQENEEKELTSSQVWSSFCEAWGEAGLNGYVAEKQKILADSILSQVSPEEAFEELKKTFIFDSTIVPKRFQTIVGLWFFKKNIDFWDFFFKSKFEAYTTLFWYKIKTSLGFFNTEIPDSAKHYVYLHMAQTGFCWISPLEFNAYFKLRHSKRQKFTQLQVKFKNNAAGVSKLEKGFSERPSIKTLLALEIQRFKSDNLKKRIEKLNYDEAIEQQRYNEIFLELLKKKEPTEPEPTRRYSH